MANLLLDERDQQFILDEMLGAESLCKSEKYADFDKDTFDMVLSEAQKLAVNTIFPTYVEADRVGCKLEDGEVKVPEIFREPYKVFCEGGWNTMSFPPEVGGQGMPLTIRTAAHEWFGHNS